MSAGPFARVDHLVIAVRDLDASTEAYAALLGRAPSWRGRHPSYGTANTLFGLRNCYLELLARSDEASAHPIAATLTDYLQRRNEGLFAIALGSDDLQATRDTLLRRGLSPSPVVADEGRNSDGAVREWRSCFLDRTETRGVAVIAIQHDAASTLPPAPTTADARTVVDAVDHVVMLSTDMPGALALWSETFGISERWRRELPERGTANVGLRLGGVTLELAAPLAGSADDGRRGERAWGIAYAVPDVDAAVLRLRAAGFALGDARPGLAPYTRVSTVKWSDRLPTLLVQHLSRDAQV
jgi:catechol 2,3-dioxygenase-like lactoylglutathione lyase family enzyme